MSVRQKRFFYRSFLDVLFLCLAGRLVLGDHQLVGSVGLVAVRLLAAGATVALAAGAAARATVALAAGATAALAARATLAANLLPLLLLRGGKGGVLQVVVRQPFEQVLGHTLSWRVAFVIHLKKKKNVVLFVSK